MSVDTPGAQMANYSGSREKFNYIDSYIEFIAEIILKYDNAIPESNNRQQKELLHHKQFVVMCELADPIIPPLFNQVEREIHFAYSDIYFFQFYKDISPPPKFS
jgi:hypothetical protein